MSVKKGEIAYEKQSKVFEKGWSVTYYIFTCSNVSGGGYYICKCSEGETEQNKAHVNPGEEIPVKGKRHKEEGEMVFNKEISGNCQ